MLWEAPTVTSLGCRLIDANYSTEWSRACAHSGMILVGSDWWHLLVSLLVVHLSLGIMSFVFTPPEDRWSPMSAKVVPIVHSPPVPFRQELASCRAYGMSDIQDLLSADSALDALQFVFSILMFDILLIPSVYAGAAGLMCTEDDRLAVILAL